MNVLIVDDEALGRKSMRQLLAAHPDVKVLGEAATVQQALNTMEASPPDLIFLDIQLRGETGFDLLAKLTAPVPHIVFVTAYDQFAVRAFECNAMDYLLKPVESERLAHSLQRIRKNQAPPRVAATDTDRVLVKSDGELRWIPWHDILSIQAEGNYTELSLRGNETLMVYRSLKDWTEQMPASFLQIHRRHLVQLAEIERVQKGPGSTKRVCLSSGKVIEAGRNYWPALRERVNAAG